MALLLHALQHPSFDPPPPPPPSASFDAPPPPPPCPPSAGSQDALQRLGYYDNTMVWFATDNGPETNCPPEGRCGSGPSGAIPPGTLHRPQCQGPGSAGPLRGRKRDVWEGGHRVPGAVSWPAVVGDRLRVSWAPVVTMDFLATVLEVCLPLHDGVRRRSAAPQSPEPMSSLDRTPPPPKACT